MSQWVSIREAAAQLRCSEDTIRRRIRTRVLEARQEPLTRGGYRWLVLVEISADPEVANHQRVPESSHAKSSATRAEVQRLEEMVGLLREERTRLWEELESRRREVAILHLLLQQTRTQPPSAGGGRAKQADSPDTSGDGQVQATDTPVTASSSLQRLALGVAAGKS